MALEFGCFALEISETRGRKIHPGDVGTSDKLGLGDVWPCQRLYKKCHVAKFLSVVVNSVSWTTKQFNLLNSLEIQSIFLFIRHRVAAIVYFILKLSSEIFIRKRKSYVRKFEHSREKRSGMLCL